MPARGGILIWTMLAMLAGGSMVSSAPAGLTHEASGLQFLGSIAGKWRRNSQSLFGRTATVGYRSGDSFFVAFTVECAEKQWSGAGLAYTDVAHFVGWPPRITP